MKSVIDRFVGENRFLSNFYPVLVEFDGILYPTAEHAYQAQKAMTRSLKVRISCLNTPGQAKRYARRLIIRYDWNKVRIPIMRKILFVKFRQNPECLDLLFKTGNAELIEGNTWGDTFWGVYEGQGKNMLGRLLMNVRSELRKEVE